MFILWIISTGALQFGYYGVSNWLPAYLESDLGIKFKEMAMYMVGTFLIMMFAKVIAGIVADKLGRRAVFAFWNHWYSLIYSSHCLFKYTNQHFMDDAVLRFPLRYALRN